MFLFFNRNDIISWETAEGKENFYYHPDLLVSSKNLKKQNKWLVHVKQIWPSCIYSLIVLLYSLLIVTCTWIHVWSHAWEVACPDQYIMSFNVRAWLLVGLSNQRRRLCWWTKIWTCSRWQASYIGCWTKRNWL